MLNNPAGRVVQLTDTLQDVEGAPDGVVISDFDGAFPLSADQQKSVCVIMGQAANYLLLTPDLHGSQSAMMVTQKLKTHKHTDKTKQFRQQDVKTVRASAAVIRALYNRHSNSRNAGSGNLTDVERILSKIISGASTQKASDIHIEASSTKAVVYYRVNGQRVHFMDTTYEIARSLGVVMYSVHADAGSKDVSWNPNDVQDGAFLWSADDGNPYQFRFSSSPIFPNGGFQIVLRMISMSVSTALSLPALGYSERMLEDIDTMTSASSGMVILCGATNSGKSTSMQAIIRLIYEKRGALMKIITVEDPVEYIIPGACQISVPRRKSDVTLDPNNTPFTKFLRGTLRQDPDIVMVGEIRDNASASIVKDSVLAGRKLITTLHTYSAFGAFLRLREIGVPWEIMTMPGFISGMIYQRLVPTLCNHCKVDFNSAKITSPGIFTPSFMRRLFQVCTPEKDPIRFKGPGCDHCKNTGVGGRTVCAEFLLPDRKTLALLSENKILEAERHWLLNGGETALTHAIHKMRQGILSPFHIEENIGLLEENVSVD